MKAIMVILRDATGSHVTWEVDPRPTIHIFGWRPDPEHPLGGTETCTTWHRRVNLKKDKVPSWATGRPFYEYTREAPTL